MNFGQKMIFFYLLVFIFGLGLSTKASAATYYVNGSGSAYSGTHGTYSVGADGAGVDGSIATPWATMQYAESRIAASGDTIYVAAATYNENDATQHCLFLQKAATWIADGTVTVRPYSSTSYAAIFSGGSNAISATGFTFDATKVNGASNALYALYLNTGSNNKTFTDCTFTNALTDLIYAPNSNTSIVFTRPTFTGNPSTAAIYANNIGLTVNSINVTSFSSSRIFYHTGDTTPVVFNGGTITAALSGRAFQSDGDGAMTITGITATIGTNGTEPGSFAYLNTAAKTGAFSVTNNNITYNLTAGASSGGHIINVSAGSHVVTITGNHITCSSTGQNQSAIRVTNQPTANILSNIINYGGTGSLQPVQITSTGTSMAVIFNNNSVTSSQAARQVVLIGSDVSTAGDNKIDGAEVIGNSIYAPLGSSCHDLEYGYNKNGSIKQNYIYGGGYGIVIKGNAENYTTGYAVENILKDQSIEQMRVKGVQNLPVYNNTFYVSSGRGITNGSLYITVNGDSANVPSTGTIAKNNLFYTQGGLNTVNCDAGSSTGLVLDNNLHYMATGISPIYAFVGSTQYQGLSAWTNWQSAGFDTHGVNSDPKLTSSSDFHLQNISLAINAGTNVGLIADFEGNPKSGPSFDIGAYEFQDSTAPTTSNNITAGTYNSVQSITLTCNDGVGVGCDKTYYTLDGSDPTIATLPIYSGAISTPDNATTVFKWFSRDRNENSETIKSRTYTIDTTAPNTTINSNPNSIINTNSATFTFSASETATFQCKLDSGAYATCTSPKNYTSLTEGSHTFYVKAIDTATNEDATPASYTFSVDTEIPTISNLLPNNTTLPVTATSTNLTLTTSETATCKYSAASGTDYASMTAFNSTNSTTHSTNISSLNSGTTYNYYIKCKDQINESGEEYLTFSVAPEENKISLNSIKVKIGREINKFKDTLRLKKNKLKLKSEDDNLANGTVKIYKNNKRIDTIDINSDGSWDKILKLKDEFSGWIKTKQYDQFGTLLSTDKAKIKIDTEDPKFDSQIPEKITIGRSGQIKFTASDDNSGIDYYKVRLGDTRDWREQNEDYYQIPENVPNGTYDLFIRAYDRSGNYAEEKTIITFSNYKSPISLATASLNSQSYSNSETLAQNINQNKNTDLNTDTPVNKSNAQSTTQARPETNTFHWWNPFSWF